jgi:FKBP-type peptidyl-prolyl cis-trans isomerase
MRRTAWILSLIGLVLSLQGCSDSESDDIQQSSRRSERKGSPKKLKYDTEPKYTRYRPPSATGLTELGIDVIKVGRGKAVTEGCRVTVRYKGSLMDGTVFDETNDAEGPRSFELTTDGVIEGWVRGLVGQKEGSVVKLAIPASLAYGNEGKPPVIPKRADLRFEIEIVRVQ